MSAVEQGARQSTLLRSRLQGGRLAGTFIMVPSPDLVEIVGLSGFDFIILDLEHGGITFSDIPGLIAAALSVGVRPVVRMEGPQSQAIGKALDVGADAVLIPSVRTAGEALNAVRASKFAPLGGRGACPRVRAAGYGTRALATYYGRENEDKALIILIESREGMENLEDILAVEGIDAIFFGYGDLAHSLGYPDNPGHSAVRATVDGAVAQVLRSGRHVGVSALSEAEGRRWLDCGVHFVTFAGVEKFAYDGCRKIVEQLKAAPQNAA